jgi:hypothetical protein
MLVILNSYHIYCIFHIKPEYEIIVNNKGLLYSAKQFVYENKNGFSCFTNTLNVL